MRLPLKVGDLVVKRGPLDSGMIGIVVSISESYNSGKILSILRQDGKLVNWYSKKTDLLMKIGDKE